MKDLERLHTNCSHLFSDRADWAKGATMAVSAEFHKRHPSELEKGTLGCHGDAGFSGRALTYLHKGGDLFFQAKSKLYPLRFRNRVFVSRFGRLRMAGWNVSHRDSAWLSNTCRSAAASWAGPEKSVWPQRKGPCVVCAGSKTMVFG